MRSWLNPSPEKHKVHKYIESRSFATTAFVQAAWYFENFHRFVFSGGFPFIADEKARAEGREEYVMRLPAPGPPGFKFPYVAIKEDFGDIVHGVFLDTQRWNGKSVAAGSESLDYDEVIAAFKKGM